MEKDLYTKFMCYCKTSGNTLSASIAAAGTRAPQLGSDIKAAEERLAQTKIELKQAQADRSAAKSAVAEATAIRKKEASAFAAEKSEADANIAAVNSAVAALEKGMAGGFVQTGAAQIVRKLVLAKQDMLDGDRQEVLSFLSGKQGSAYA